MEICGETISYASYKKGDNTKTDKVINENRNAS